jgi:hypothetical protein
LSIAGIDVPAVARHYYAIEEDRQRQLYEETLEHERRITRLEDAHRTRQRRVAA